MSFIGKIAYLALFPGALSLLLAGAAGRRMLETVSVVIGAPRDAPSAGLASIIGWLSTEPAREGVFSSALAWTAPPVKLFAVSWVACVILGFLDGDLALVYFLLLLALAAHLVIVWTTVEPSGGNNAWMEGAAALGCAVALGLVMAGVSLRTGEVEVARVIGWQVKNGLLVGSGAGGALAQAGSALGLAGALVAGLGLMRLRPFRSVSAGGPAGGTAEGLSGPPLATLLAAEAAMLFVSPLLVVSLFLAGGAGTWYEVGFWALKVLGVLALSGVADAVTARFAGKRALVVLSVAGCAAALAGLLLIWVGVLP